MKAIKTSLLPILFLVSIFSIYAESSYGRMCCNDEQYGPNDAIRTFASPGACSRAGETISIINFSPSSSQIQFDQNVKTEVSIKQRNEKSVGNQGYYSLVVEGSKRSRAEEVYGLLRKFDGPTQRYGASDVDSKIGENVVCIHSFQRYGVKSEEERDYYRCSFRFGTADNQGGH